MKTNVFPLPNSGRLALPVICLLPMLSLWSPAPLLGGPTPPPPPPMETPAPPPANVSSGEGGVGGGGPTMPQKRQEQKNPPQPPVLLTKIEVADPEDWARTPNDLEGLLSAIGDEMDVHFSSEIKRFSEISLDPTDNPILYRSGYKPFQLSQGEIQRLRDYIMNGGTVIFNALVGNPDFYESALQAAQEIMPERTPYRLRMDHPVFHSFHTIDRVEFRPRLQQDGLADGYPYLMGVDIDNRTGIFISRWDFSLGWEENPHESWGYADEDARRLGANLVSYVTAMQDAGRSVGQSVELIDAEGPRMGKFRVGRVAYDGQWMTRSAAFPMLLNQFHESTGAPVSFELADVRLTDETIFEMPFLYLSGTTDFELNPQERSNLRMFLQNGGVLFAEASEGRASFDQAFREEVGRVLPGSRLVELPPSHPIYQLPMDARQVQARPALSARSGRQTQMTPTLYGVEVNGALAVIYSPHDLSAGWERAVAPYTVGYEAPDATRVGLNVLFHGVAQ